MVSITYSQPKAQAVSHRTACAPRAASNTNRQCARTMSQPPLGASIAYLSDCVREGFHAHTEPCGEWWERLAANTETLMRSV